VLLNGGLISLGYTKEYVYSVEQMSGKKRAMRCGEWSTIGFPIIGTFTSVGIFPKTG
jgi:hypothetical protein